MKKARPEIVLRPFSHDDIHAIMKITQEEANGLEVYTTDQLLHYVKQEDCFGCIVWKEKSIVGYALFDGQYAYDVWVKKGFCRKIFLEHMFRYSRKYHLILEKNPIAIMICEYDLEEQKFWRDAMKFWCVKTARFNDEEGIERIFLIFTDQSPQEHDLPSIATLINTANRVSQYFDDPF